MAEPKYKRVLIKLSGEALAGERGVGIDLPTVKTKIKRIAKEAIVINWSRKRLNMGYSSLIGEKAKVATFFTKNADVGLDGLQFLTQIGNIDPDNRLIHIFLILPNSLKKVLSR